MHGGNYYSTRCFRVYRFIFNYYSTNASSSVSIKKFFISTNTKAMKEPTVVYHLKPIFEIPHSLALPTCMYKMKNPVACVAKTNDHTDDEKEILAGIMDKVKDAIKQPPPELASLELRWDSVLQQLSDLKLQMKSIRSTIAESCRLTGYSLVDNEMLNKVKVIQGAVINASVSSPPYFLLLLKRLAESSLPISISSHIHSTISSLPDSLECFSDLRSNSDSALKLTLIWKDDITESELVLNPVKQLPIKGDVNILRLFARAGFSQLQYPSQEIVETIQTDSVLDISHRVIHTKTSKEKASLLKNLNAKLGRSGYFGGDEMNICDVAVWSALKQINVNPAQDLSPSLAKWYARIDQILF